MYSNLSCRISRVYIKKDGKREHIILRQLNEECCSIFALNETYPCESEFQ